jgi:hypothetical protein
VTFSDGSTIVTDANHLWVARPAMDRNHDRQALGRRSGARRWPGHPALAVRLNELPARWADDVVTVTGFEDRVSDGARIPLLRRGINDGRFGLSAVDAPPDRRGRFVGRTNRFGDLSDALLAEVSSAAPSWCRSAPRIVTTNHMRKTLRVGQGRSNWSVEAASPLCLPPTRLPVDPWLLGYWLGDRSSGAAVVATADEEVLNRIRALGYRVTHYAAYNYGVAGTTSQPSLKAALQSLGVLDDKHVPQQYLRSSQAQRSDLLAGLLDADGTCSVRTRSGQPSGVVTFTNVNRRLIDAVAELAGSLGFIPTVRPARPAGVENCPSSVAYGRATRETWIVSFTPDRQVFGLGRKQRKLAPSLEVSRRAVTSRRYVVAVDHVASVPVRCIAVDSPTHLYLAGRAMIPTHNTRENYGQRTSMGPLSPEGAQMMWNNPVTGVTLPRGRIGRAIGQNAAGVPVEMQCYRVPDPKDTTTGTREHELLTALRPAESRQERLVIVPPSINFYAEDPIQPTFTDYAQAEWVRAQDRPDLDPLANQGQATTGDGRALSSPMALFGLTGSPAPARPDATTSSSAGPPPARADLEDDGGTSPAVGAPAELGDGYGPSTSTSPAELCVGDLVCVDADLDAWAVVEEEPLADFDDEDSLVVAWRDDQDTSGQLILAAEVLIPVRRPLEVV